MRIDADRERKIFWIIFDQILTDNGEPFTISHEMSTRTLHWGTINNDNTMSDYMLSVNFLAQKKEVYVHIYIRDDLEFYSRLLKHKDDIENIIGKRIYWERGEKNPNTRSIRLYEYVEPCNYKDYQIVIEDIMPIIPKFIEVINKYGEGKFFK